MIYLPGITQKAPCIKKKQAHLENFTWKPLQAVSKCITQNLKHGDQ